jgi:hypothetical protein
MNDYIVNVFAYCCIMFQLKVKATKKSFLSPTYPVCLIEITNPKYRLMNDDIKGDISF